MRLTSTLLFVLLKEINVKINRLNSQSVLSEVPFRLFTGVTSETSHEALTQRQFRRKKSDKISYDSLNYQTRRKTPCFSYRDIRRSPSGESLVFTH